MCDGGLVSLYEIEEDELIERFRSGELCLYEFEYKLEALRKYWEEFYDSPD